MKVEATFHSRIEINLSGKNEKKLLNQMIDETLENTAQFQRRGNNWRFEELIKLEIHLVKFNPLKGNPFIPLPKEISLKRKQLLT